MTVQPTVIDISHWQNFPDFDAVKAAGVIGVIMKATEGTGYVDPNRRTNFVNATNAGLKCCCYFWLKPGDGAAQAAFFLDTVVPVWGERVVIDYEEDGCTLDQLKKAVQALLDYDGNLQVTVYSGHLLKQQLGSKRDEFLATHTDLWLAQYTSDFASISWPSGTYPQWSLHQFSDKGSVPGVAGDCDCDRFNGSNDECLRWLSGETRAPQPAPDERVVRIQIDTPDDVAVEIVLNGVSV